MLPSQSCVEIPPTCWLTLHKVALGVFPVRKANMNFLQQTVRYTVRGILKEREEEEEKRKKKTQDNNDEAVILTYIQT